MDASPGSSRAAVASTALAWGVSLNNIMQAADWASARTMFVHYVRFLSSEVLTLSSGNSVQSAIMMD